MNVGVEAMGRAHVRPIEIMPSVHARGISVENVNLLLTFLESIAILTGL